MNVFFVPYGYPNEYNNALCVYLKEQAEGLKRKGLNIVILHARVLSPRYFIKKKINNIATCYDEFDIERLITDSNSFARIRQLEYWDYKRKITELFNAAVKKHGRPDLILANFSLFSGRAMVDIAEKHGIPCMVIEHYGHLLGKNVSKFEAKCLKYTLEKADEFVCVSSALKDAVLRLCGKNDNDCKISVIPNAIAPEFSYKEFTHSNKFIFLSVGNLYVGKRFSMLIEAFAEAFKDDKNVELRIVGDGNQYGVLKSIIQKQNLQDKVYLLGRQKKEYILEEYKKCSCFVLPSEHETFGIVYREAMAVGRPIITTKHQGFENEWSDDWGIIIDIDNKKQLTDALRRMKREFSLYDLQKISSDCISRYSTNVVIEELFAHIMALVQR